MFAAGNSVAASEPNYIESVFSTYLYTGTGAAQTITNGIDLAGKGGLVWLKNRTDGGSFHRLEDTVRGAGKTLYSNSTLAESSANPNLTSFNANGFSVTTGASSLSGQSWASWTFREQPKFFDIVTYTGNGINGRQISHLLGSVPGCIIVKSTSLDATNWIVHHRSLGFTQVIYLNSTLAAETTSRIMGATSTNFTVSDASTLNSNGATYVAYLFAHNAGGFGLTGTDNVVSCGTYTGNGTATGPTVTLGYEPQWIMVKSSNNISNWIMLDNMRGVPTGGFDSDLYANLTYVGSPTVDFLDFTATGFIPKSNNSDTNGSGSTYIYIAIRRGPMKTPTLGTSVFNATATTATTGTVITTGFPVDAQIIQYRTPAGGNVLWQDRLRGVNTTATEGDNPVLTSNDTSAESSSFSSTRYWDNNGYQISASLTGQNRIYWNFRRAPGFFDEVCYTGNGSTAANGQIVAHNLTVSPELLIIKPRSIAGSWITWASSLGVDGSGRYYDLLLETSGARGLFTLNGNALTTSPIYSTTQIGVGGTNTNASTQTYVAYLFATCAGVSKVGSYTGTGALQTVACGFTSGARFVLIKRTDSTGDWYVWDSARGITSGNDPYLLLNSTAAEVTATNYVDTDTTGFKVTAAAPAGINASGGTFLFLAIA